MILTDLVNASQEKTYALRALGTQLGFAIFDVISTSVCARQVNGIQRTRAASNLREEQH